MQRHECFYFIVFILYVIYKYTDIIIHREFIRHPYEVVAIKKHLIESYTVIIVKKIYVYIQITRMLISAYNMPEFDDNWPNL